MSKLEKKWDVEILHYEKGVQPRYRLQTLQHTDEYLATGAIKDYFGANAGQFLRRVSVAVVDNEGDAIVAKRTLRQYFNAIGVTILGRGV